MRRTSKEKERKNNEEENKKNSKQTKEDKLKKILLEKLKEIKAKEDKKIEEREVKQENEIVTESKEETQKLEEIEETSKPIVKTPLLISTKSREGLEQRLELSEEKEEKPKRIEEERKYVEFKPIYNSVKGVTKEEVERRYELPAGIERKEELEKPRVLPFRREKQMEGELTKKDIREEYRIEEEKRQEDLYKKKNFEMR